jgi:hypothetical protein
VRLHDGIILQQVLDFGSLSADRLTALIESLRYGLLRGSHCRINEGTFK